VNGSPGFGIYSLAIGIYSLASVFGVFFYNVGNDLRIYLTLVVTNCSGERPFSELMVE